MRPLRDLTRTLLLAVGAVGAGLVLAACGSDRNEVVTFTDSHGRVCTAIINTDGGEDGDVDASAPDCDYPPAGRTPGPAAYQPLPDR
ncbi:MAG: hypothetical protein IRZ08_03165 [Frankia sp.]|nr:hypothetical protein [Frankia sp.]